MIALRNASIAGVRWGVALIAAAPLLFASCGNAVQFLASLGELRVVEEQVGSVAGTHDVSVNLQNDRVLTITIGDAGVGAKQGAERQELFRRIAAAAYLAFPSRSQVEAVAVARATRQKRDGAITDGVVTESQRFRPVQLIEPSGLTEHWLKPREVSHRVYLVGVGHVRPALIEQLAGHFRQTLGIDVEELPAVPFDRATVDSDRSQVVAEELVAAIRRRYPAEARDGGVRIIGVTGDDMFLRSKAGSWAFGFSWRSEDGHMAVVSYARMDPAALGLSPDPDMLRSRVTKMVAKDIGVLCFGLPLSNNPRSALYGNIGGTDELDVMTEYFEPQPPTTPASR
jgi:predicted Zn-dependent protease